MNRSELQRLLQEDAPAPADSLPGSFAIDVLSRGKLFRQLVRQHWRWLSAASVVSILIAIALGMSLGRPLSDNSQPLLLLFQNHADAAPFSTR